MRPRRSRACALARGRAPVLALFAVLGVAALARADGGLVVARKEGPGWTVTVFVAPVPPRAGPADVSVLVQDTDDDAVVLDAEVEAELLFEGRRVAGPAAATREEATNRLLYATTLAVPAPGEYVLHVSVRHGGRELLVEAVLEAGPPLAPADRFWPWLALPALVVAVFLLHQWLRERSGRG